LSPRVQGTPISDEELDALIDGGDEPTAPASPDADIDALIDQQDRDRELALRQSLAAGLLSNPDEFAKARALAGVTGLPTTTVASDLPAATRAAAMNELPLALSHTPVLRDWMSEPDNAAVAHDDIGILGKLEKLFGSWSIGGGIGAVPMVAQTKRGAIQEGLDVGNAQTRLGVLLAQHLGADPDTIPGISQLREEAYREVDTTGLGWVGESMVATSQILPGLLHGAKQGMAGALAGGGAAAAAGQLGPQVALPEEVVSVPAAATAGGIAGAAKGTYEMEAGLAYDEIVRQLRAMNLPVDYAVAGRYASSIGIANALIEIAPLKVIARLPGLRKVTGSVQSQAVARLLKRPGVLRALTGGLVSAAEQIGTESAAEGLQAAVTGAGRERVTELAGGTPNYGAIPGEALDETTAALESFWLLALPGAGGEVVGGLDKTMRARLEVRAAEENAKKVQALVEAALESKLATRQPVAFAELSARLAEKHGAPKDVFVDVEAWTTLWQGQNEDPAAKAEEVLGQGGAAAYREAVVTKNDLVIPLGAYLARLKDQHEALKNDLATTPWELTPRKAAKVQEEADAQLEGAVKKEEGEAGPEPVDLIRDSLAAQLSAAGTAQDVALAQATPVAHFFTTMAKRIGLDPLELFDSYEFTVGRGEPASAAKDLKQPKAQPNPEISSAARGYARAAGIEYDETPVGSIKLDEELSSKVADWYDEMQHDPKGSAAAYKALKRETKAQYEHLKAQGYTLEPWTKEGQPYANSAEMAADLRENKHLYFFTGGDMPSDHPLAEIAEDGLTYNDLFRAVHDAFGHGKEGNQFGAKGEMVAWLVHSKMFSPEARAAMSAETFGQNSWVNYGKHLRNEQGMVPRKGEPGYKSATERPYAAQKAALMPAELLAAADKSYGKQRLEQSAAFASNNVAEGTTYKDAVKQLRGPELEAFRRVAEETAAKLGVEAKVSKGIGDWSDGAEGSLMLRTSDADPSKVRRIAAHLGRAGFQKSVLTFVEDDGGPDHLYEMLTAATPEEIRAALDKAGIKNRTMVPAENGRYSVEVVAKADWGGVANESLKSASEALGGEWQGTQGRAELIGGDTRAEGRRAFEGALRGEDAAGKEGEGSDLRGRSEAAQADEVGQELLQSSVKLRRGQERLRRFGLKPGTKHTTRKVALALEARQQKLAGTIGRNDRSPEAARKLSRWLTEEALFELENVPPEQSAVGWYSVRFQRALDALAKRFPELRQDQGARNLMTLLFAATSDGQKITGNFSLATTAYEAYRETGKLPGKEWTQGGTRASSMRANFARIQELLEEKGADGLREYLLEEHTVKDIRAQLRKIGQLKEAKKGGYKGDMRLPMSAVVLGPKLGVFYANLAGADGYLTMDRWWSRTFNRMRGTLVKKPKQTGLARFRELLGEDTGQDTSQMDEITLIEATRPYQASYEEKGFKRGTEIEKAANTLHKAAFVELEDAPFNASDREFMVEVAKKTQAALKRRGHDLSIADLQAVLWYYEKRLYGALGARQTRDISYEEAALEAVGGEGDLPGGSERSADEDAGEPDAGGEEGPGGGPREEELEVGELAAAGPISEAVAEQELLQSPADTPRGSIRFRKGGRAFDVRLGAGSDRSTFLHEAAHFFLEVYGDIAYSERAPEQIVNDYETLLQWFGVKTRDEITPAHHEKFAESFERYLAEGKAPSRELASVFARFRAWLTAIYGRAREVFGGPLPEDVRGVFDRMLATDEQILATEEKLGYAAMFQSAEDAGMTDEQFAAYQAQAEAATEDAKRALFARLTREQKVTQDEWYKAEKAKVEAGVKAELSDDPVQRALHLLRTGEMLDGTAVPEELQGLKLSKDGVSAIKGAPFLQFVRGAYADLGVDPDVAAELMGFSSGDEMLSRMAAAEPLKTLVARKTDALMKERYGDALESEPMPDKAMQAVHSEARADVLFKELRSLARRLGVAVSLDRDELQRTADRIVGGKRGDQVRNGYHTAELRAATEAGKAMAKGDLEAAYLHKQQQLLNFFLGRAVTKAKQDRIKAERLFKKVAQAPAQQRLGKSGIGAREQMNALLRRFGVEAPTDGAPKQSLDAWAMQREAAGQDVDIAEWILAGQRTAPVDSLTVNELRDVRNAVRAISKLATEHNEVLAEGKKVSLDAAVAELSATAAMSLKDQGPPPIDRNTRDAIDKAASWGKGMLADLIRMETIIRALDGYDIKGAWHRYIWNPFQDAKALEADLHKEISAGLEKLLDKLPADVRKALDSKVEIQGLEAATGRPGPVTRMWLISAVLNMGNEENLQRLIAGNKITPAIQKQILERLTKEETELVQGIWDLLETMWPEIAALHERRTGVPLGKVEAVPVYTPHGTLRGGYFPLVYDRAVSPVGEMQDVQQIGQLLEGITANVAATARSHTKARVSQLNQALKLDSLNVLPNHIRQVIHDLAFREFVVSAARLIRDPRMQETLRRRLGENGASDMWTWLKGVASYELFQLPEGITGWDRWLENRRSNAAAAVLAGKVGTAIQNFANLQVALATVGPKYLARGLQVSAMNPVRSYRFAAGRSPEIRHRMSLFDRDVREQVNALAKREGWGESMRKFGFGFLAATDIATAVPIWIGAYRKGLAAGLDERTAARAGDEAVRRTIGSSHPGDLPRLLRARGPMRLLTQFHGYMNAQFNIYADLVGQARFRSRSGELLRHAPQLVGSAVAVWLANALLAELLVGRGPDDDEDKWEWAARKAMLGPLSMVPLGGATGYVIESQIKGGSSDVRLSPVESVISKTARAGKELAQLFGDEPEAGKATLDTLEALGLIYGVAGTAQARYVLNAILSEESQETNATFLHDALFGQPRSRRK
jgi:hypothetical protein